MSDATCLYAARQIRRQKRRGHAKGHSTNHMLVQYTNQTDRRAKFVKKAKETLFYINR
jgi:hypothetical protein